MHTRFGPTNCKHHFERFILMLHRPWELNQALHAHALLYRCACHHEDEPRFTGRSFWSFWSFSFLQSQSTNFKDEINTRMFNLLGPELSGGFNHVNPTSKYESLAVMKRVTMNQLRHHVSAPYPPCFACHSYTRLAQATASALVPSKEGPAPSAIRCITSSCVSWK